MNQFVIKPSPLKLPIEVVGCTNESINACILLATLNYQAVLWCDETSLARVINEYQFDRQMILLWEFYLLQGKIVTKPLLDIDKLAIAQDIWLFVDDLSLSRLSQLTKLHFKPTSQIILSGVKAIGEISRLATKINSAWVYYLPFIFMKDGANFNTFFQCDLVLIGEKTAGSSTNHAVLQFFLEKCDKQHITDIKTAEFARSSIMGMLATRLSFMNEMARLADSEGVYIKEIENILGLDKRIGKDYLQAGWGFGGKSLPSELTWLVQKFEKNQVETTLLESVQSINEDQKELIFRKFWRHFDGFIEHKTVVIWGAGYRSGTGRTTASAIHPLLKLLWSYHIKTWVYAHNTKDELLEYYSGHPLFELCDDAYAPLQSAHALFIINWSLPMKPNVTALNRIALPIFDAKNVLEKQQISQLIGDYIGIGYKKEGSI